MNESSIPIIEPDEIDGTRTSATICGILLAAGTSSRYGDENKLLTNCKGDQIVRRAIRTLVRSELDHVIVVLGYEADRVHKAVEDFDISVVVNESYELGMGTSVRAGVEAARERSADAVLIALGDMPNVMVSSVNTLVEAYERGVSDVIAVAYEGQRGNPVIFDSRFFDQLTDSAGDVGGRTILLSSDDTVLLEVDDPGLCHDIDLPEDKYSAGR